MGMMSEFKEFAIKGNMMDMAVGIIIGAAFSKIVDSLVKDIIMPLVGKIFGDLNFSEMYIKLSEPTQAIEGPETYESLTAAGASLFAYGNFITVLVNFLILAFIIFQLVKAMNKIRKADEEVAEPSEDILLLREIRDGLNK